MIDSPSFIEVTKIFGEKANKFATLMSQGKYKIVWSVKSVEGRTVVMIYLQRKKGDLSIMPPIDIESMEVEE